MKHLFLILFLGYCGLNLYGDTPQVQEKKLILYKAIDKLKDDKRTLEDFYFIGRKQCYLYTKIGKPKYLNRAFRMMMDTNRLPFNIIDDRLVEKYFKNKFTDKVFLKEKIRLAPNQDIYKNSKHPKYWTAHYVCDTLNRLTEENIKNYKDFLENYKKEVPIKDFYYETAKAYLNKINDKSTHKEKKLTETAKVVSLVTKKEYIAEASAIRGSIWLANLKIDVPKKYIDDLGRVGKMKNKPIIATAKKFKKFMDSESDLDTITVETNAICKLDCVKEKFKNNKGLYIFIPKDPSTFGRTGHVTLWDENTSNGRDYYEREGNSTLYIIKP